MEESQEEARPNSPDWSDVESRDDLSDESADENDIIDDNLLSDVTEITPQVQSSQNKSLRRYPCHVCRKSFDRPVEFRTHLKTHAGYLQESDFLMCCVCGKRFQDEEEISNHLTTHSDDEISRCDVCSEPYNHFTRVHTGPKPFKCPLCTRPFRNSTDFHSHLNMHAGLDDNRCELCGKGFARKDRFRMHMQEAHGLEIKTCGICKAKYQASYEEHKKTHNKLMYIECNTCHKVFSSTRSLCQHNDEHHDGGSSFTCNPCGMQLADVSLVKKHVRKHFPEPSHRCNVCHLKFFTPEDLASHKKTHTGTVPDNFPCTVCPKRFLTSRTLNRHEKNIHGKRLACKLCDLTFSHPDNLYSHVTNIHPGMSLGHYCALCKMTFSDTLKLDTHNKTKHGESVYRPASSASKIVVSNPPASLTPLRSSCVTPETIGNNKSLNGTDPIAPVSSDISETDSDCINLEHSGDEMDEMDREIGEIDTEDSEEVVYECRFCGKRFSGYHHWRMHRKRHKAAESVKKCQKCRKLFGRKEQFTKHSCVPIKRNECDICDEQFSSAFLLIRHRSIHKGPIFKCYKCNLLFTRKCNLERHTSRRHPVKSDYNCLLCPKTFSGKKAHTTHLLSHFKTAKSCAVCKTTFPSPAQYDNHIEEKHKIDNMYTCQICSYEFMTLVNYKVHLLAHSASAPYKCLLCCMRFRDEYHLLSHQQKHISWSSSGFVCNWCGTEFTTNMQLRRHKYRNRCWKGKSFQCIACGDKFHRFDLLQMHTKTHMKSTDLSMMSAQGNSVVDSRDSCIGNDRHKINEDDFSASHDNDDRRSETVTSISEKECNNYTSLASVTMSDDLNAEENALDADSEGPVGSVMFSCGMCNREFVAHSQLQRHIKIFHNREGVTAEQFSQSVNQEQLSQSHNLGDIAQRHIRENVTQHHDREELPQSLDREKVPERHGETRDQSKNVTNDVRMYRNSSKWDSGLYKCGLCEQIFMDIEHLNDHISNHADDKKSYQCGICSKVLNSLMTFHRHCSTHVKSKAGSDCRTNDVTSPPELSNTVDVGSMTSHSSSYDINHSNKIGSSTHNPSPRFETNADISKHTSVVTHMHQREERPGIFDVLISNNVGADAVIPKPYPLKCDMCDKRFDSEMEKRRHTKQHTSEKETQVDVQMTWDSAESVVIQDKDIAVTCLMLYKCARCPLEFSVPSELVDHSKIHVNTNDSIICLPDSEQRNKDIDSILDSNEVCENNKKSHRVNDTLNTACHTCRVCKRAFDSTNDLVGHCRIHVTSPRIAIRRLPLLEDNFSGSVLISDFTSTVYKTTSPVRATFEGNTCRMYNGYFSSDSEEDEAMKDLDNTGQSSDALSYKCKTCGDMAPSAVDLKNHVLNKHSNSNSLHRNDGQLTTSLTSSGASNVFSKEDISRNNKRSTLRCKICSRVFSFSHGMNLHYIMEHQSDTPRFPCGSCQKVFLSVHALHVHMGVAHENQYYKNKLEDLKVFTNTPSKHRSTRTKNDNDDQNTTDAPFECIPCDRAFKTLHGIRIHVNNHSNEVDTSNLASFQLYRCLWCSISFDEISQLCVHVYSAHSDRKHSRKTKTMRHMLKETDVIVTPSSTSAAQPSSQPTFTMICQCLVCNKEYPSTFRLRDNCKKCREETTLLVLNKCLICERKFRTIPDIQAHMLNHAIGDSKKRPLSGNIFEHVAAKIPKSVRRSSHQCLVCGRFFTSQHVLQAHMTTHPHYNISARKVVYQSSKSSDQPSSPETKLPSPVKQTSVPKHVGNGLMRYKCRTCSQQFSSTTSMLRHMKTHTHKFQCDMCGETFNDAWTYQTHRSSHKVNVRHACDLCQKEFSTLSSLVRHKKSHTGKRLPYRCDVCSAEYTDSAKLKSHCKMHINEIRGKNEDTKTDDHFDDRDTSEVYQEQRGLAINFDDSKSNRKSFTDLQSSRETMDCAEGDKGDISTVNGDENGYTCDICDKTFNSIHEIQDHCRSHTESQNSDARPKADSKSNKLFGQKIYNCQICDKNYLSPLGLSRHFKTHKDNKTFVCHLCDKKFDQSANLRDHLLTHNQDFLYKCSVCGQQYNNIKTFLSHKRTHSQNVAERCARCAEEFENHKDFLNHTKECEIQRSHVCYICGKGCRRKCLLTDHMQIHKDKRKFRCSICDNRYTHERNLKHHMETAHIKNINLTPILNTATDPKDKELKVKQELHRLGDQTDSTTDGDTKMTDTSLVGDDVVYTCTKLKESGESVKPHAEFDYRDDLDCTCKVCGKVTNSLGGLKRHMIVHKGITVNMLDKTVGSIQRRVPDDTTTEMSDGASKTSLPQSNPSKQSMEGDGITIDLSEKSPVNTLSGTHCTQRYKCFICGKPYVLKSELERHLGNDHRERLYRCEICNRRFVSNDTLKRHVSIKHKSALYKCRECDQTYPTMESIQSHIAVTHPQHPYACTRCDLHFQSMSEKHRHVTSVHPHDGNSPFEIIQPEPHEVKSIPKRVTSHIKCSKCDQVFPNITERQNHMVKVHETVKYPFSCSVCGQTFPGRTRLKRHQARHSEPFSCPICQKKFNNRQGLTLHVRYHSKHQPEQSGNPVKPVKTPVKT